MIALTPQKEPNGLLYRSGEKSMDVFIPAWTNGKGTCLDITMINPFQTATVCQYAEEGDHVVNLAHRNKVKLYQALCTTAGLAFSPLAVYMFWGWHKEALAVITRLGT